MSDWQSPEEKRAQRRAEKAARAKIAQDDAVVQSFMATPPGREWISDLLKMCGVFRTSAHENPYYTYLNEGQRNVGLRILADIMRACPQAYIEMMQESQDGRRSDHHDRADPDDDRNYDSAGRWVGEGSGPGEDE